jgi:hypothetical protein
MEKRAIPELIRQLHNFNDLMDIRSTVASGPSDVTVTVSFGDPRKGQSIEMEPVEVLAILDGRIKAAGVILSRYGVEIK